MRILFLCGCLEPGRDGVGDYTRLIAAQLEKRGNEVLLISLFDRFVLKEYKGNQESDGVILNVLQIPGQYSGSVRLTKLQSRIEEFGPDWISLQYVAYSFHSKGLNGRFPFFLKKIRGNYSWHLMIHEPWIRGRSRFEKAVIIGWVQKLLLKLTIQKVNPKMIHTSNPFYQECLRQGKVTSALLHLPSNIPKVNDIQPRIVEEFNRLGINDCTRGEWIILGTFGRMTTDISYIMLFEKLLKKQEFFGKKIAFFSVGNAGAGCPIIFRKINEKFGPRILTEKLGERSPAEISTFLQLVDYGVASVPKYLIGKSGAYAAMRNHGVKIIVPESEIVEKSFTQQQISGYGDYLLNIRDHEFSAIEVSKCLLESFYQAEKQKIQEEYENSIVNA